MRAASGEVRSILCWRLWFPKFNSFHANGFQHSQAEFFELPQLFSVATEVNLQIDIQRKETSHFAAAKRLIKGEKWSSSTVSEQF